MINDELERYTPDQMIKELRNKLENQKSFDDIKVSSLSRNVDGSIVMDFGEPQSNDSKDVKRKKHSLPCLEEVMCFRPTGWNFWCSISSANASSTCSRHTTQSRRRCLPVDGCRSVAAIVGVLVVSVCDVVLSRR